MPRTLTTVAAFAIGAVAVVGARLPAQEPSTPATSSPPQAPSQIPPVFRGEVDLIRLDVSVLDRSRRPVTGLSASDFTIVEDGVPQTIGAFTEVLVAERDPKPTAWMRHTPLDVATNDVLGQIGEGRPYAIVMDDWNIRGDDWFFVHNARAAGREIVSRLGPSDVAAVIFVHQAGRTVDFTTDRVKLLDAINGFEGRPFDWLRDEFERAGLATRQGPPNPRLPRTPAAPWSPGGFGGPTGGGDMPVRTSEILGRSDCEQRQPLVPALEVAARRLAMVPNRRKTIALVSTGIVLGAGPGCGGILRIQMNHVYGVAEFANINIYTVDVADDRRLTTSNSDPDPRRLFLEDVAEYTGGLIVGADGESMDVHVERIFAEAGSYYLLGYQSTQGAPDGTFRRLEVRVNRPGVLVRARSGYFAPTKDGPRVHAEMDRSGTTISSLWDTLIPRVEQLAARPPSGTSLALTGLYPPAGLPLRVNAVAIGPAGSPGASVMNVAIALSVRLPPARTGVNETLTLLRHIYDGKGRAGLPVATTERMVVTAAAGDEMRYEVLQRLTLPPGRHEMRLNARSAAIGRDGSVFTTVDVPDITGTPVALSGVVLGTPPAPGVTRADALADVLPIVPTSARSFTGSAIVAAWFQVFQGGAGRAVAVTLKTLVIDRRDQAVVDRAETLPPDAFDEGRGVARQIALPLSDLPSGPYLLSITATRPDGFSTRHDVRFDVR